MNETKPPIGPSLDQLTEQFAAAESEFVRTGRDHLIAKMNYEHAKNILLNRIRPFLKDGCAKVVGNSVFIREGDEIKVATLTNI